MRAISSAGQSEVGQFRDALDVLFGDLHALFLFRDSRSPDW